MSDVDFGSVGAAQESRVHRIRLGDRVSYEDRNSWPPTHLEGEVVGFGNVELTYLLIDFGDETPRELTEDEVTRIG